MFHRFYFIAGEGLDKVRSKSWCEPLGQGGSSLDSIIHLCMTSVHCTPSCLLPLLLSMTRAPVSLSDGQGAGAGRGLRGPRHRAAGTGDMTHDTRHMT